MLDKDEIERQLQGKSREHCVAFAVRSAMRVLPLLAAHGRANGGAFRFWWERDRAKHLLAVYWAYSCSMQYVLVKDSILADAVAYAARSARTAAYADARAVTYAAARNTAIIQEIQTDLAALKHVRAATLLTQPLWSQPMPGKWRRLLTDFESDALSLDAGFEVWLDWYQDRLDGKAIDIGMLKNWNNLPDELRSQGAAKVNAYLKSLQNNTSVSPLNKVRAIFIGYGEAGKTSLIRALHTLRDRSRVVPRSDSACVFTKRLFA